MNLGATTLLVCTNEQPKPERIGEIPLLWLSAGSIHQPLHQLMGDQLKPVGLGSARR